MTLDLLTTESPATKPCLRATPASMIVGVYGKLVMYFTLSIDAFILLLARFLPLLFSGDRHGPHHHSIEGCGRRHQRGKS